MCMVCEASVCTCHRTFCIQVQKLLQRDAESSKVAEQEKDALQVYIAQVLPPLRDQCTPLPCLQFHDQFF